MFDKPEFVEVDANLDVQSYNKMDLKDILSTEKILINYRIKEILNHIDKAGYTIIYTEYVGKGIIQLMAKAIQQNLGLTVARHTGSIILVTNYFKKRTNSYVLNIFSYCIVEFLPRLI